LPLAAGIGAAIGLSLWIPPDGSVKTLYDRITLTTALPFLLSVSLFPGFFEELFWRGYVQRRLLARWSPWIAISVTALIFGLFHVTPHSIVNAFIVGLWLGVLAYKTDSIWPGVVCHAFINGSWNLYQVGERLFGIPEQPPMLVLIVGGAVIVVCFCASVGLIFSRRKC
jgi:membrane protease YdiL (CAAX protease family)